MNQILNHPIVLLLAAVLVSAGASFGLSTSIVDTVHAHDRDISVLKQQCETLKDLHKSVDKMNSMLVELRVRLDFLSAAGGHTCIGRDCPNRVLPPGTRIDGSGTQ